MKRKMPGRFSILFRKLVTRRSSPLNTEVFIALLVK
jgi:hypothetical protein